MCKVNAYAGSRNKNTLTLIDPFKVLWILTPQLRVSLKGDVDWINRLGSDSVEC